MAVGVRKPFDGRTRHQKVLEDAVVKHHHPLPFHPFVVEVVKARQFRRAQALQGGIGNNGEVFREKLLPYHFLERLPFVFVLLPMAFNTVAEHFVEENPRWRGRRGSPDAGC